MNDPAQSADDLDSRGWRRLDDLASRLETAWNSGAPVDLTALLPAEDDPFRSVALIELIKVDMECRWRRGRSVALDYYVDKYKELGARRNLSPQLIFEEYRVRQLFGDRPG